jgi:hypothetical protein
MEKLDLIIDALRLGLARCPAREMGHFEQALAAARELKELKPVAWVDWSMDGSQYNDTETSYGTPLYTL